MVFSIQKIENLQEFRNLKNAWDGILESKKHYHPFFDHDWFKLWVDHFLDGHKLLVLTYKENDRAKAICPFLIKNIKFMGIQVREIELTGNIYSPVRNFILGDLSSTEREGFLLSIFKYLRTSVKWDIADLSSLPEEDFDLPCLIRVLNKLGLKSREYFCFGNWYLDEINFSGDEYIQSLTTNIRGNLKRYGGKLKKMGNVEFVIVTSANNEKIDYYMDLYYQVYNNSWKTSEMDPTFHKDLAKLANGKGWLRLGFLFFNQTPIATQFWLVSKDVAYILKLAYDENFEKFRPGMILSSEMMKYVINVDKVREVDYLIGDEPYKKDWTPKRRERKGVIIFNQTFRGFCSTILATQIAPFLRRYKALSIVKKTAKLLLD